MRGLRQAWCEDPARCVGVARRALRTSGWIAVVVGALLFAGCGRQERPAPDRLNLLLLSVDTLRADHLGAWGHPQETSPHLDALAESGVRFADATAQWPKTWPSMASMLTGRLPTQTGVRHAPRRPLPARNRTLAEILGENGYGTAAVVSNANLGRQFAFDQGFDHFVEAWMKEHVRLFGDAPFQNRPGLVKRLVHAPGVIDEGLDWLEGRDPGTPFFLWLHFMEPHGPYLPPEEYAEIFRGTYPSRPAPQRALPDYQIQRRPDGRPVTDVGFYEANYAGEIRAFDEELGRLLRELERRGLRGRTLVVLTADHGENMDEHRYYLEHGALPFQPGVHVPLLLSLPGVLPEGRVVVPPVGLVDLVPTVLEILEVPAPPDLAGRSLMPAIEGVEEPSRPVFLEAGRVEPSQRAVRRGPWKLVHFRSARERGQLRRSEWELYHLGEDPGEERNVIGQHPEVAAELRAALEDYSRTAAASDGPADVLEEEDLDPEIRDQLRALGYLEEDEAPPDPPGD
jgi:arylsulfatase A-like enzyme